MRSSVEYVGIEIELERLVLDSLVLLQLHYMVMSRLILWLSHGTDQTRGRFRDACLITFEVE